MSRKGSGRSSVLLLGHYDTVDIAHPGPCIDGNHFYSLGSFDMKGGLAIAVRLFAEADREKFSSLELLVVGDEETRSRPLKFPGSWDAVLSFEGGEDEGPVISRFGASEVTLTLKGVPTRATFPLRDRSTLLLLSDLLPFLHSLNSDGCHFTAASVIAESACNVVAHSVEITGVLRYGTEQERSAWISSVPRKFEGADISIESKELIPALLAKAASRQLLEKLGLSSDCRSGASDISWFRDQAPILIDGLGPLGGGEHSPDEFIVIDSLQSQYEVARLILDGVMNDRNQSVRGF